MLIFGGGGNFNLGVIFSVGSEGGGFLTGVGAINLSVSSVVAFTGGMLLVLLSLPFVVVVVVVVVGRLMELTRSVVVVVVVAFSSLSFCSFSFSSFTTTTEEEDETEDEGGGICLTFACLMLPPLCPASRLL